jgi:hypothetical protein
LAKLHREFDRDVQELLRDEKVRLLALLNTEQLQNLHHEADVFYHTLHEATASGASGHSPGMLRIDVDIGDTPANDTTGGVALPVYEDLGQPAVARQLDLTKDQRRRLVEIAKEFQGQIEGVLNSVNDQRDLQRKRDQIAIKVRREVESLLTPKQLSSLTEIVFQRIASVALGEPAIQEKIGLSSKQKSMVNCQREETRKKNYRLLEQIQDRVIDLFAQQQKKLQDEIDRQKRDGTL